MEEVLTWILKKWGLVSPKTRIHNDSGVPILLIPYVVPNGGDTTGSFDIRKDLAKKIKAGGKEDVNSSSYDLGKTGEQIFIRFYAGKSGDNGKDITAILQKDYGNRVPRATDAKCCMHTYLYNKRDLYLNVNNGGQVTGLDDNASQTSNTNEPPAAGTQIASDVAFLKNFAQILKKMGEELEAKAKDLGSHLAPRPSAP